MASFSILLLALLVQSEPDSSQWFQDVSLIISRDEKSQFAGLNTDEERFEFVEEFWRRRDPDPSTEYNEFRQEHFRRLDYANKEFGFGKPGWRTDRGRAYIIHGEPDERLQFPSRTMRLVQRVGGGSPLAIGDGSIGDALSIVPEMEIWTYYNLPGLAQLRGAVSMVFLRLSLRQAADRPGFESLSIFRTPESVTNAGSDFMLMHVGEPRSSVQERFLFYLTSPVYAGFESLFNVGDAQRSPGDRLDAVQERERFMREQVESAVFFGTIETHVDFWFLQGVRETFIPMTVHVPGGQLEGADELTILVEMTRDGKPAARFSDIVSLKKLDPVRLKHEGFSYQSRLSVRPGNYHLRVFVLDQGSSRLGRFAEIVEVPEWSQSNLSLSEVILCTGVESISSARKRATKHQREWLTFSDYNPLQVDDLLLQPAPNARFKRRDDLVAFMEIYRPRLSDGEPDVELDVRLIRDGKTVGRLDSRRLRYTTRDALTKISYALSLDLAGLQPGKYHLAVEAIDHLGQRRVQRGADFELTR